MNVKRVFLVGFILSIGLSELLYGQERIHLSATPVAVVEVKFCDLVKNQEGYAGKSMRTRATFSTLWESSLLYDPKCKKRGIRWTFDCSDEEKCSSMQKMLEGETYFDGDEAKVEAVLIGSLILANNRSPQQPLFKFMIKDVEYVAKKPNPMDRSR